jgi:hypothetical protein
LSSQTSFFVANVAAIQLLIRSSFSGAQTSQSRLKNLREQGEIKSAPPLITAASSNENPTKTFSGLAAASLISAVCRTKKNTSGLQIHRAGPANAFSPCGGKLEEKANTRCPREVH